MSDSEEEEKVSSKQIEPGDMDTLSAMYTSLQEGEHTVEYQADFLQSCVRIGRVFYDKGQVVEAAEAWYLGVKAYQEALIDVSQLNQKTQATFLNICSNAGDVYYRTNQIDESLQAFKNALQAIRSGQIDIASLDKDVQWIFLSICYNAGILYGRNKQPVKALASYENGLQAITSGQIDVALLDKDVQATFLSICYNAGILYGQNKQPDKQLAFYKNGLQAIRSGQIDVTSLDSDFQGTVVRICYNAGVVYNRIKQFDQSLQSYEIGLQVITAGQIDVALLDKESQAIFFKTCYNAGVGYGRINRLDEAISVCNLAFHHALMSKLQFSSDICNQLANLINMRFLIDSLVYMPIHHALFEALVFSFNYHASSFQDKTHLGRFFNNQPHQSYLLSSAWLRLIDPIPYTAFKASLHSRTVSRVHLIDEQALVKDIADFYLYHLSRGVTAPSDIATALNKDNQATLFSPISAQLYHERVITLRDMQTGVPTQHALWQAVNRVEGSTGLLSQVSLLVSLLTFDENQQQKRRLHWLSFDVTQAALASFHHQALTQSLLMRLWDKAKVKQQYNGLSRLGLVRRTKPITHSQGVTYSALPNAIKCIHQPHNPLYLAYQAAQKQVYQRIDSALRHFTETLPSLAWHSERLLLSHVVSQASHEIDDSHVNDEQIVAIIKQWCHADTHEPEGYHAFIAQQIKAKAYREQVDAIAKIEEKDAQQIAANKLPSKPIWGDVLSSIADLPDEVFSFAFEPTFLLPEVDQASADAVNTVLDANHEQRQRDHIQVRLLSAWQHLDTPDLPNHTDVMHLWHSFERFITDDGGQSIPLTSKTTLKWVYLSNQHESIFHALVQRYLQQHYPVNEAVFSRQHTRWGTQHMTALAKLRTRDMNEMVGAIKQQLSFFISYPDIESWQQAVHQVSLRLPTGDNVDDNSGNSDNTRQALLRIALDGFTMNNTQHTDAAQLVRWLHYFANEALNHAINHGDTALVWQLLEMRRVGLVGSMQQIDAQDMRWSQLLSALNQAWTYSADMDNAKPTELHPLLATWKKWCFDCPDARDNLMPRIRSSEDVAKVLHDDNNTGIDEQATLLVQVFSTQGGDISESRWHVFVLSTARTSDEHDLRLSSFNVEDSAILTGWSELYRTIDAPFLDKPAAFDKAYQATLADTGVHAVLSYIQSLVKTTRVALLLSPSLSHLPWEFLIAHLHDVDIASNLALPIQYTNRLPTVSIERVVSVSHWRSDSNTHQHTTAHPNEHKWCAIYNSDSQDSGTHYAKYDAKLFLNSQTHTQKRELSGQLNCLDVMDAFSQHSHIHITAHGEYSALSPWSMAINLGRAATSANTVPSLKLPLYALNDIEPMPVHVSLGSCELARDGSSWLPLGMASGLIAKGATRVIAPLTKVEALPNLLFYYYLYQSDKPTQPHKDTKAYWLSEIQDAQRKVKDTTLAEIYDLLTQTLGLTEDELTPLTSAYPLHTPQDGQQTPFHHPIYWSGYVLLAGKY